MYSDQHTALLPSGKGHGACDLLPDADRGTFGHFTSPQLGLRD